MEIQVLESFVALAEELNFRRAARRVKVAQPTLSRQIANLELRVGATLLNRTHHHVALTRAGETFLEEARELIRRVDQACQAARDASHDGGPWLRVAHVDETGRELFRPALPRFRQHQPEVNLTVTESDSTRLTADLESGRLDVALVRELSPEADVARECLINERLFAAIPKDHSLARDTTPLAFSELAGESFVAPPEPWRPELFKHVAAACREAGFDPAVSDEAHPLSSAMLIVRAGRGLTLVPEFAARPLEDDQIHFREMAGPASFVPLYAAWRRPASVAVAELIAELRVAAKDLAASEERSDVLEAAGESLRGVAEGKGVAEVGTERRPIARNDQWPATRSSRSDPESARL